jgi:tetratricopeptide (TPR) repeat protein
VRQAALALWGAAAWLGLAAVNLEEARDRQDRAALENAVTGLRHQAEQRPQDADAQYQLALAASYLAEVSLEVRDRPAAKAAAEAGIRAAERAVALKPEAAEHHRILGTLCGQIIPANLLMAFRYGDCAQRSVQKAIELDPKSARAYVSRGVGNYYLPPAFGGGVEAAIRDFDKAIELDPRLAEAHLWRGIALRKAGRNAEAHRALARSLELNPRRVWTRQQLEKTPAR